MIQLVYVSTAWPLFTDIQIGDILSASRKNNTRDQITGMLLYRLGSVVQVLEGGEIEVRRPFEVIRTDRRHRDVTLIYARPIEVREFDNWAMGFRLSDTGFQSMPDGSSEIEKLLTHTATDSNGRARALLKTFNQSFR